MNTRISSQALFEEICHVGKEKNIEKLNAICQLNSIDLRDSRCLLSPAGELARVGDKPGALWLFKEGANPHLIGMGAAMGGNNNFAEEMRKKHGANLHFIAKGAAIFGDFSYAMYLHRHHGASIIFIAEGAAIGKHLVTAEHLRSTHINETACIPIIPFDVDVECDISFFIARGAILGGNWKYAERLRNLYFGPTVLHEMAFAASLVNNVIYAEYLRNKHQADINYCLAGALLGGHEEYFEQLTKIKKLEEKQIKKILAFRGFIEPYIFIKPDEFREEGGLLIEGLVWGGHNKLMLNLIDFIGNQYLFPTVMKAGMRLFARPDIFGDLAYCEYLYQEIDWIMIQERKEMITFDCFVSLPIIFYQNHAAALHRLSFIDNKDFLNALQMQAINVRLELAWATENFNILCNTIIACTPLAIKINETKKKYNLDYDEAKALLEAQELRKMIFLLIFSLEINTLPTIPPDISLLILMNFSPLTYFQTETLYNKMSFFYQKTFFIDDLNKYCQGFLKDHLSKGKEVLSDFSEINNIEDFSKKIENANKYCQGFFKNNINKAKNLITDISKTKTKEDLYTLIDGVDSPMPNEENDKFYAVVENHRRRFRL